MIRSTWWILGLTMGLVGAGGCRPGGEPGPWHQETGYRWRDLAPAGKGTPGFTAMTPSRTGITFRNDVSEALAFANRHLVQGAGVAIGDIDGDGRPDVYLSRIDGPNALYHNLGGWRFEEIAAAAGVALGDRPSTGAAFADVDGDGDLDLIVVSMGGRNSLFLNDGHGRFTDGTAQSGFVPESRGSTSVTLADVDGDGDLDLYVTNYKAKTMLDSLSPQERAFDQVVRKVGDQYQVIPALRDNYRVVLREDIRGVSLVQRADPDWFYLNDGKGHFARETLAHNPRFRDENGKELDREPDDFGLAAKFFDANGDGAPDLYVANDFEDPDQFWINDGHGNFHLIGPDAIRQTSNSGMAVDVSDVVRDGNVDIFEVDMLANDSHRLKTEIPTHTPLPKVVGDYRTPAAWQRNVLLDSRGDGTYAEVGVLAGVEASGWSWSTMFLDVDLDGYEDILIGNGHRWDLMDADVQERLRSTMVGLDWREERKLYPRLALKNVAFRNQGDLTFADVSQQWRFGLEDDISHGMAAADLDGDGDLDVVINRLDAPAKVLRNDAPAPRVLVELAGRAPNTEGIGAVIRVLCRTGKPQRKEISAGGLYLSSSAPMAAFAALSDSLSIEVHWPSGAVSTVAGRGGRLYRIDEPPSPPGPRPTPEPAQPIFEDASALLNHVHADREFDDYARQPLLLNDLSRFGPGVGWVDLDGDGLDDLVVGSGAGGRLAAFHNDRGRFVPIPSLGMKADDFDLTGIVPDGTGGLLVGQSSYEAKTPAAALAAPAVYRIDTRSGRVDVAVGGDTTSAGPIAVADVDGDGALDLFVGGRVAPGVYPLSGNSRLFRNEGGRYQLDQANLASFRGVGMVAGAVFSDIDGDGDPDLILATEWGPIKVMINDHGTFTDQTKAWGLDGYLGRWSGVAVGDFDGDGRLDIVATNWGRNSYPQPMPDRPVYLYFGNWGGEGGIDMTLAQLDPRINGIAPLITLSRLTAAVADQRQRTPTFAAYADATIDQALGGLSRRGGRLALTTVDHMVFLNRGGRFEGTALPVFVQTAPGFGVTVADFDGDGIEDLFLAQNFSATDIATPRLDAARGSLLLGDGKGGFRAVGAPASGIGLAADQRGAAAADFDGDGRVDLVVGENAAQTRLFHNRRGKPGLRVRFQGGPVAGVVLRLKYSDGLGPAQETHLGSGFWSQDGAPVLGKRAEPVALVVRWPGGRTEEVPLSPGEREVVLRRPAAR